MATLYGVLIEDGNPHKKPLTKYDGSGFNIEEAISLAKEILDKWDHKKYTCSLIPLLGKDRYGSPFKKFKQIEGGMREI